MVWVTANDVRLLTGLTTSDISDTDLDSLIALSQREVLLQINNKVVREKVEYIDSTRKNDINGTNTVYYIKNWEGKFISDYGFDIDATTMNFTLVSIDSSSVESSVAITSVTYNKGKFTVTSAQNNVDLYVTYAYTYFDPVTPDPLLKLASEYLAGAYAYMRINSSQKKSVKFGNVSISNSVGQNSAYSVLFNKYMDIIRQLNENAGRGAIWGKSNVSI